MFNCAPCCAESPDTDVAPSTVMVFTEHALPFVPPPILVEKATRNSNKSPTLAPARAEPAAKPEVKNCALPQQEILANVDLNPVVRDWEVIISKSGDKAATLGLSLIFLFSRVAVVDVVRSNGLVEAHNKANKDAQILPGDTLVCCNSVSNDAMKMIELFKTGTEFKLSIRRVIRFTATINLISGGLGLQMDEAMTVKDVLEGSAKEYNRNAEPGYHVMPNDCIIAVDGKMGSAEALWLLMYPTTPSAAVEMTLTLHRGGMR